MGTVLHPRSHQWERRSRRGFSPLLDGDGVASIAEAVPGKVRHLFQSPSRWGRCCIAAEVHPGEGERQFQSPSRWGRCCIFTIRSAARAITCFSPLLDGDGVASSNRGDGLAGEIRFQSPSRWGRCCIISTTDTAEKTLAFQSPSRWGRCCIVAVQCVRRDLIAGFSPLLDGDGVASRGQSTEF